MQFTVQLSYFRYNIPIFSCTWNTSLYIIQVPISYCPFAYFPIVKFPCS